MNVLCAGSGGFIGGHLVKSLLEDGHSVTAVDIKPQSKWYQLHPYAENSGRIDLGDFNQCLSYTRDIDRVYNLAADMGGMGYIAAHRVDTMNSVLSTTNLMRAARLNGVEEYLFASSACVYNDSLQQTEEVSLVESDAWPADPEPAYGLEKLFGEELCKFYLEEYGMQTFSPRFHNIMGPYGTYDGGREKAPAAICRKVAEAKISGIHEIDIWGDGEQTRSFLHVDQCVEGMQRIIASGYNKPINLGSDQGISINELVSIVEGIAGITLERHYLMDKPQGVRGRNSDNTLIREVLGWAPEPNLVQELGSIYSWVYGELVK